MPGRPASFFRSLFLGVTARVERFAGLSNRRVCGNKEDNCTFSVDRGLAGGQSGIHIAHVAFCGRSSVQSAAQGIMLRGVRKPREV
ncbi:uncharacterized protein BDV17DRAFT_255310 [Aspergillus undulatus]|uniref:uncharacterized protein n=1 Tax=Aspergillus undulatus TaxID=1810928 RepID=UPI003CCCAEED